MKITQISSLSGRAAGLLAKMIELAPLFRFAEFKLDPSTFLVNKEGLVQTGSAARVIGQPAVADAQSPNTALAALCAYTREITVDEMYLADANVGTSPQALKMINDRKLNLFVVALAQEIQHDMTLGSGIAPHMLGLLNFVLDAAAGAQIARLGFTQAELAAMNVNVGAGANGSLQLVEDNYSEFLETLEKQISLVIGANALICNTNLAARITTIARQKHIYGQINDAFNNVVDTILGVPICKLQPADMPSTETDGVNNDCTSLHIVRFAEELGMSYSTNNGFTFTDFPESEITPQSKARMSFHLQLSPEMANSYKRLSRIRL
jgi:hypothetical protein